MANVKNILKAAMTLMLICAVVTAALAATNMLTAGPIAENEKAASVAAQQMVLPAAVSFDAVSAPEQGWQDGILEVLRGADADGATVGYVVKTSTKGKGKGFVMMTGIDAEGTVCGLAVVSDNETAGYVDKVQKGGLFDRLHGDTADVDAVAGATKTSTAVKDGVALALAVYEEVSARG